MSRGLVQGLAWSLSTGAAVTLSWWGVHTVMAGTAYDRPRALPITAQNSSTPPEPPRASPAPRTPGPSASPSRTSPSPSPSRKPAPEKPEPPAPEPSPSPEPGNVKGYTVDGGRVVFDIGDAAAELVSATPDAGWQMQVWKQPTWIRVTFTQEGREVSVFCTWNGHPPMVQFDER